MKNNRKQTNTRKDITVILKIQESNWGFKAINIFQENTWMESVYGINRMRKNIQQYIEDNDPNLLWTWVQQRGYDKKCNI